MENKERDFTLDLIKAVAILCVVIGHILEMTVGQENMLYHYIYSFNMPVFFIVSGMLVGYKKITLLYVMKKMKFLIPLYVLGFFYNYYSTGLINFDWFFLAGTGKYWFFMAMVHCFIIYGITFFLLSMCKHKRAEIFVIIFSVVFALSVKSLHVYGGGIRV